MTLHCSTFQEEFPASRPSPPGFDPVAEIRRLRCELAESVGAINTLATDEVRPSAVADVSEMLDDSWCEGDVVRYASRSVLVPMIATSRSRLSNLAEFSPRLDLPPLNTPHSQPRPLESHKRETVEKLVSFTPVIDSTEKESVTNAGWGRHWASCLRSMQTPACVGAPLQSRRRLCQFVAVSDSPVTSSHRAIDGTVLFMLLGVAAIVVGSLLYLRGHQAAQGNIEMLGLQIGCIGAVVLAIRLVGEALTPKSL